MVLTKIFSRCFSEPFFARFSTLLPGFGLLDQAETLLTMGRPYRGNDFRGRGRGGRRGRGGWRGRGGGGGGGFRGRWHPGGRGRGGGPHFLDRRHLHVFGDHAMNETSYFFENGLRKVRPYYFTFSTYAKGRWVGRTILDVYSEEFLRLTREEYKLFIEAGNLKVNNEAITPEYIIKEGDFIHHKMHRHENPVTDKPIEIIDVNEDLVVVNKPSSIPVHPCGSYRHNSVVFILGHEHKLYNLRTIYRLDRLTSGVLVLGRSAKRTIQLENQIRQKQVLKEYVCRVVGEFPSERVECTENLDCLSAKMGIQRVCPAGEGKESMTIFERMSFNGKTSVVKCKPLSGRTHQIRVHLQFLGHPIVNDPIYNSTAFGPNKGKEGKYGGKTLEQVIEDIKAEHSKELLLINYSEIVTLDDDGHDGAEGQEAFDEDVTLDDSEEMTSDDGLTMPGSKRGFVVTAEEGPMVKRQKVDPDAGATGPTGEGQCKDCKVQYKDPDQESLTMYLHAFKYEGPDWEYGTDMPEWARRDWVDPTSKAS